jgi:hypothetical protein
MAEVTYRVDDLDGKTKVTGDSTSLSLNGRSVTIDLSNKHVDELVALLAPYFDNGVEVTKTVKANGAKNVDDRTAEIRAWAVKNGHDVSDRGRLPKAVVEAFEASVNADVATVTELLQPVSA